MTDATLAVDGGASAVVGMTPYPPDLLGLQAMIMPDGLGEPITPPAG